MVIDFFYLLSRLYTFSVLVINLINPLTVLTLDTINIAYQWQDYYNPDTCSQYNSLPEWLSTKCISIFNHLCRKILHHKGKDRQLTPPGEYFSWIFWQMDFEEGHFETWVTSYWSITAFTSPWLVICPFNEYSEEWTEDWPCIYSSNTRKPK